MAEYSIEGYEFKLEEFFPARLMSKITDLRASGKAAGVLKEESRERKARKKITKDGKLTILAADHPARRVTGSGGNAIAMGDRQEYLGRVLRVATAPEFDGVMGTTDILEDLFLVQHFVKKAGGPAFLDGKVLLGCMNRGGLSGVVYEMDDRMTSFTAKSIKRLGLDGAKLMFRIADDDERSGFTTKYCADAVTELNALGLYSFLEVLPVENKEGKFAVKKNVEDLVKAVGVASGMGDSSARVWLKIPYCEGYETVARATTLPILMLGGESKGTPVPTIEQFCDGMNVGGAVRGALVGRNVTYPGKDDPLAVALAINAVVHENVSVEKAVDILLKSRGRKMDLLRKIK